ncbi:MAG: hypothetical protein CM15mP120_11000 [Pseudomonadota bacterium]|nr:MAG: hypothetical protein CM15mP120_11000 [Pseudomonadota bacterium]
MVQAGDWGEVSFSRSLPNHVCINDLTISPPGNPRLCGGELKRRPPTGLGPGLFSAEISGSNNSTIRRVCSAYLRPAAMGEVEFVYAGSMGFCPKAIMFSTPPKAQAGDFCLFFSNCFFIEQPAARPLAKGKAKAGTEVIVINFFDQVGGTRLMAGSPARPRGRFLPACQPAPHRAVFRWCRAGRPPTGRGEQGFWGAMGASSRV